MRLDFGDAAAIVGFLGVVHKMFKGSGRGYSGAYEGAHAVTPSSRQFQGAGDAVHSMSALQSIRNRMQKDPVVRKLRNVTNAYDRARIIRDRIQDYGIDPYIRKLTGDLLTGRMDVWGRVRSDDQFTKYRQMRYRQFGQPWAVPEKDWPAEVKKVFEFIRTHVRYTRDPAARDTYTSAERTLAYYNIGDCDCYTILAGAMMRSIGYPVKIRIIWLRGQKTWGHIYLMVGMPPTGPTRWLAFDASINKPVGTQAPRAMVYKYKDFVVKG
jgi:hypothetical protein